MRNAQILPLHLLVLGLLAGAASPLLAQGWITPPVEAPGVLRGIFESEAAGTRVSYHIYLPDRHSVPRAESESGSSARRQCRRNAGEERGIAGANGSKSGVDGTGMTSKGVRLFK